MHLYLITGINTEEAIKKITNKTLNFPVLKIEDARELKKFIQYNQESDTYIRVDDIDKMSLEAANALLKTLEEPLGNTKFILTAKSQNSVLPTILSRCQIINTGSSKNIIDKSKTLKYIKGNMSEKMEVVMSIKDRSSALEFIQNMLLLMQTKIEEKETSDIFLYIIKKTITTGKNIELNGNPFIQLSSLAVEINEKQDG